MKRKLPIAITVTVAARTTAIAVARTTTIAVARTTAIAVARRTAMFVMAVACALAIASGANGSVVHAAGGLDIVKAEAVSEFPDGIRFVFEATSEKPIDEVIVRFAVSGQPATQYNYLKLTSGNVPTTTVTPGTPAPTGSPLAPGGQSVSGEYFHRTGQRDRYVPPGAEFTYFFEILFKDGATETTKPATVIAHDSRYRWESLTKGAVTVFYHGPVQKRAEFVADVTLATFENMGPVTGADTEKPIRIVMYNNDAEMIGAVSISSLTSARQLITEGQAFAQHNLVIVQAGADRAAGIISHEVTHILVGRATESAVGRVPLWLNEGLAEYGNLDPGLSYVRFLEWAVDTNRLVPIIYLDSFPADPNLTIVAYGEARSIVEFMIDKWGQQKVAELLAEHSRGTQFVEAVKKVYGFDLQELDRQWRVFLGAKPYVPSTESSLPTREPQLQLTPFTLEATPAGTATPVSTAPAGAGPVPTIGTATPAGAVATETGTASPVRTATPVGGEAPAQGTVTPQATATSAPGNGGGGGCSAGTPDGPAEASALALLVMPVGLFGLRAWRRLRSR